MREWKVAVVSIFVAIALFVAIDVLVKEAKAHEQCHADPCTAIVERAIVCTDKSEACRWARRMAARCLPRKDFEI